MRATLRTLLGLVIGVVQLHAGASGIGSFENDDAWDWVENELRPFGLKGVERAIGTVVSTKGHLEAPLCCAAIAACEVLAAAQARPSADLPKEVVEIAKKLSPTPAESLRSAAREALTRILTKSELRSLWADSKEFEQWRRAITDLKGRM